MAVLEIIAMLYVTIVIILSIPNMGWFMFFMGMLCFITFPVILVSLFYFSELSGLNIGKTRLYWL